IKPWCIDLFADEDLQRACTAHALPASAYPRGLLEAARQAPPGPWLYTGALENHPGLIEALTSERPLWGNPAMVVRQARSPERIAGVLHEAGLPCPAVGQNPSSATGNSAQSWLVKPRRSAGGTHVKWWRGQAIPHSCYGQEWIDGVSCSALYAGQLDGSAR